MRWLIALLGCVPAVSPGQARDPARQLFEAMEQKLTSARGYQVDFESEVNTPLSQGKAQGTLILASGNRLKLTIGFVPPEPPQREPSSLIRVVSDGRSVAFHKGDPDKPEKIEPVNDVHQDTLTGWGLRIGLFFSMSHVNRGRDEDYRSLKVSDFKTVGKQQVEGRPANVIAFTLLKGSIGTHHMLWLDAETGLPLKFVAENPGHFHIVETYCKWELDPRLPDATFAVPKDGQRGP
jgi:outer membrane lipoprotein-sorting protein